MATENHNLSVYDKSKITVSHSWKIAIAVSKWNEEITEGLLNGAKAALIDVGIQEEQILVRVVPGSFELPLAAQLIYESLSADAVICLGSVIKGETKHFDYVCQAVSSGIKDVGLKYNKPTIFGVLTDNKIEQSRARSGGNLGNKGTEAAITAIEMLMFQESLK
jgi:6,7-dimethyl-8-ribityllumazine synthase